MAQRLEASRPRQLGKAEQRPPEQPPPSTGQLQRYKYKIGNDPAAAVLRSEAAKLCGGGADQLLLKQPLWHRLSRPARCHVHVMLDLDYIPIQLIFCDASRDEIE